MDDDRTRNSTLRQLTALQKMQPEELKEKWRDLYGSEPPQLNKVFLLKRLAFRIQELYYGGLSKQSKGKLQQHMSDIQSALNSRNNPLNDKGRILPGTRFIRVWHGQRHEVVVRDDGFEYNGQIYRSLSAVALKITGTKWNGIVFFNAPQNIKQREAYGN